MGRQGLLLPLDSQMSSYKRLSHATHVFIVDSQYVQQQSLLIVQMKSITVIEASEMLAYPLIFA